MKILRALTGFFLILGLEAVELQIKEKTIHVNGKEAKVLTVAQPDGTWGLKAKKGEQFDVTLRNNIPVSSSVHWHGVLLPNDQDGVAFVTQFPIYPGQSYRYKFPIKQSGTFWMHSHVGLQEQSQLSAPLIFIGPEDSEIASQEVVMLLGDFSFKDPSEIFLKLRTENAHGGMKMGEMSKPDIVEVKYDALLTNDHTLDNPEIIEVAPGSTVRLRIIDGASATNFFIDLGNLEGQAIAVDGNRINPLTGKTFELAVAQRIDILVSIPKEGGVFPILAQGESIDLRTGIILATKGVAVPKMSSKADKKAGGLTNKQESELRALYPLARKNVDQKVEIVLGGNMANYIWTLNGQSWPEVTPVVVTEGQRVEMAFRNDTTMSHPMHLHGHVFEVVEIDGKRLECAVRDTVLVMPNQTVVVQFDADNPGVWPLHCHILYHLEAGMMTVVRYKDSIQPLTQIKKE